MNEQRRLYDALRERITACLAQAQPGGEVNDDSIERDPVVRRLFAHLGVDMARWGRMAAIEAIIATILDDRGVRLYTLLTRPAFWEQGSPTFPEDDLPEGCEDLTPVQQEIIRVLRSHGAPGTKEG